MTLRERVIALAKKTTALRSRVIAHDKSGHPSRKLKKAYLRAKLQLAIQRRAYAREQRAQLRLAALAEARVALARHIFETGGNNRGPQVEAIINYAHGQVPEPWCVDFVIWCYGHAGSKDVKPGFPRAVSLMLQPGLVKTHTPRAGDVVRYVFDHTGIFEKDNGDGTITTIEGNTGPSGAVSDGNGGDGVYRKVRSKNLVQDYLRVTG